MKRKLLIAGALAPVLASLAALAGPLTKSDAAQATYPVPHPTVSETMHEAVLDAYKRVIHI